MDFAQALNQGNVEAGTEEGRFYLTDDQGNEVTKVGDFTVLQTNAGPDLRLDGDSLVLYGLHQDRTVTATYSHGSWS